MPSTKKKKVAKSVGITPNDVASSITRLQKTDSNEVNTSVIRYNNKGQSDEKTSNKFTDQQSAAARITSGRKITFRVKVQRGGRFYNPTQESFSYGLTKRDRTTNNDMFTWQTVSPKSFEAYTKFLQTRYENYLTVAEREV